MFSIDIPELRGQMAKKNKNIVKLSGEIGVDRNTLAAYFVNPNKMPYRVISSIASALNLSQEEATSIFLKAENT